MLVGDFKGSDIVKSGALDQVKRECTSARLSHYTHEQREVFEEEKSRMNNFI